VEQAEILTLTPSTWGWSSSSVGDDTRSGAYSGARTWGLKSSSFHSMEQCSSSSTVGAASSDEEDNGVQAEDNTLRRRRTTLMEARESKSSLLDAGTRELAGYSRGPLPSHDTRELAGSPGVPLPNTNVQELAERNPEELLEELGRLTAELNHRLELQKQKKEDSGCGPTGALWGPPAVRPVSRSGPTSGFYEPQVV